MKVGYVQIFVSDFGRAVEFYEDCVGLSVTFRDDDLGWAEMATEGATLALRRAGAELPEAQKQVGRPSGITLLVPDLEAVYRSLSDKAVRFSRPPTREPWGGLMTSFFDPDGNEISLLEEMPQG